MTGHECRADLLPFAGRQNDDQWGTVDVRSYQADKRRALRVRAGQPAIDTPVALLRLLLRGSAHGRTQARRALGDATVDALLAE